MWRTRPGCTSSRWREHRDDLGWSPAQDRRPGRDVGPGNAPSAPIQLFEEEAIIAYDAAVVGALGSRYKASPVSAWGTDAAALCAARPGLDLLPTPLVTVDRAAMESNIAAMSAWASAVGVDLAPHGKTTMAPSIWRHQLRAGAWGLTLATPWQLAVALDHDVPRVIAAYPVTEPDVLRLLARPRTNRVLCWVDGADVVALMAPHLAGAAEPLEVLIELGAAGGRTGARSIAAALEVARAVAATGGLRLAGVGGYEGALAHDATPESLEMVHAYLQDLHTLHEQLLTDGLYPVAETGSDELVVTAGGSAFFDVVAEVLAPLHDPDGRRGRPVRTVVRAGASVAHDDGFYADITPMARGAAQPAGAGLVAALHGWTRIISRPEPGLALADAGKRDLPFDEGLPVVQAVRRGGIEPADALEGATVTAMNDQHLFVRLQGSAHSLAVGDVLRLGLSHPCTTFDKWQLLPVLDDARAEQPRLVDWVLTVFG